MKDTIITAKRKKTELITMLICFLLANIANLYSIITFNTSYLELITSLGYVVAATIIIYALWSLFRIIFYGIAYMIPKKKAP